EDSQARTGRHRNFFPDRAGVPLSNGLEIRSLFEHSLLCSTLHRCSQAELEAPIAGVAVCNSPAAQATSLSKPRPAHARSDRAHRWKRHGATARLASRTVDKLGQRSDIATG